MGIIIHRFTNQRDRRWLNNVVPFRVDSSITGTALGHIQAAVTHWNTNTPFQLTPQTTEPDFIVFLLDPQSCSSPVGRQGGSQHIACALQGNFNATSVIHEIAHAVGFWHEVSRSDRNAHVQIISGQIQTDKQHNFVQHVSDGIDIGTYDFNSIMHYPPDAFAIKSGTTTIQVLDPNNTISNNGGLSVGDIQTALRLSRNWILHNPTKSELNQTFSGNFDVAATRWAQSKGFVAGIWDHEDDGTRVGVICAPLGFAQRHNPTKAELDAFFAGNIDVAATRWARSKGFVAGIWDHEDDGTRVGVICVHSGFGERHNPTKTEMDVFFAGDIGVAANRWAKSKGFLGGVWDHEDDGVRRGVICFY